ncbi:MAG: hypothetical protein RL077_2270 [Verrucomicrobiota bacterium]|jgi:UDP-N-acetyl-D-galactosamine dehydrogenase
MPRPTFDDFVSGKEQICVLGLGYVGLPLAAAFAKKFRVVGFDINTQRVAELESGHDRTRELTAEQLAAVKAPSSKLPAPSSSLRAQSSKLLAPSSQLVAQKV